MTCQHEKNFSLRQTSEDNLNDLYVIFLTGDAFTYLKDFTADK